MDVKKFTGIVLDQQPYGEFDRMISLFSPEAGRIRIIGKGVRKIHSHRGFHLDIFNYLRVELEEMHNRRTPLFYLREVSPLESFRTMKKNPQGFLAASLIAKFLERTVPECTAQKTLFFLTYRTFQALERGAEPKKITFLFFLKIMRMLGYLPEKIPKRCAREILSKTLFAFDPQFSRQARRTLRIFSN